MHKNAKVLLITEGKTEENFFVQIAKTFNFAIEIVEVKSNIYTLYNYLKKYDFQCDIKKAILDISHNLNPIEKIRYNKALKDKYAYTYLVYDFDVQHGRTDKKQSEELKIMKENIAQVSDMVEYFVDETDDTIGKIYINYPMMESYRDIDSFNDENYNTRIINVKDLKHYKSIAGNRLIARIHLDKYTINNFLDLLKLNIKKLLFINDISVFELERYFELTNEKNILMLIKTKLLTDLEIYVLNTSIFFISDYNLNLNFLSKEGGVFMSLNASDGSAFVTKTEFDAAIAELRAEIAELKMGNNSKIDSQVASYIDRNGLNSAVENVIKKYIEKKN